jgi:hypothetical protein
MLQVSHPVIGNSGSGNDNKAPWRLLTAVPSVMAGTNHPDHQALRLLTGSPGRARDHTG